MIRSQFVRGTVAALAASSAVPRVARAQSDAAIRIGSAGKESDAQVYYAQDLGSFAKAGLTVDVQTLPNGAAVASAVASGALDIGDANLLSFAVAREKGLPFKLIAAGALYTHAAPTTQFVVAPAAAIHSAKDLNGQTVAGVSLGGLDQIAMEAWIDKNGGDATTVKFVELTPGAMVPALVRGTVAAASLADPFLTVALAQNDVRVLGNDYDAIANDFIFTAWFATTDWAAKNPQAVRRFADAIAQTSDWANASHDQAAAILMKYTKVDASRSHVRFARRLEPALIQPVLDAGLTYMALKTPVRAGDL